MELPAGGGPAPSIRGMRDREEYWVTDPDNGNCPAPSELCAPRWRSAFGVPLVRGGTGSGLRDDGLRLRPNGRISIAGCQL